MLHSVLIANEVVDEAKRGHKSCMVFKVNYEKAYDSVSWEFLIYMMRRLGFGPKWTQWMLGCLKSASISVLVNGSPTKEFYPQRGLRQGDLLSPLLFNIVAEGLSGLMSKAINRGLYRGFLVGINKVEVSLLQYVDDTIFLGEATMENVRAIKAILRAFELASGLKINFAKSSCGAFSVSEQWTYDASNYLNYRLMSVPFAYLGIPIGANPRRYQIWDPLITKCERKLARWKQRHFFRGESDSHKFSANIYSNLFFYLFSRFLNWWSTR